MPSPLPNSSICCTNNINKSDIKPPQITIATEKLFEGNNVLKLKILDDSPLKKRGLNYTMGNNMVTTYLAKEHNNEYRALVKVYPPSSEIIVTAVDMNDNVARLVKVLEVKNGFGDLIANITDPKLLEKFNFRRFQKLKRKIWQIFFYVILAIWSTIIVSALYYMITGDEILMDTSINLNLLTLPFLIIILFYTFLTVVLFVIYLITDRKVKLMQNIAYSKFLKNSQGNNALCTVIIASRNEDSVIRRTVEECLKQTYLNIEIVVVCHNCTDKTFEESSVNDGRIRVFDYKTKEAGKGIALNFGVQKSHGEYILILDADGILSKDFIEKALPLLKD